MRIDKDEDRQTTTETDGDRQRGRQGQDREAATVQPEPEAERSEQPEAERSEQPEAPTVQPVISMLPHMRLLHVISDIHHFTCEPCQACLLFERLYLTVTCFVLTCFSCPSLMLDTLYL